MARNYIRGSGKTGRINETKNPVEIKIGDQVISIMKETPSPARMYMGHPVTVVPCMNRVRYDRALTAKPTTQYHDPELDRYLDRSGEASSNRDTEMGEYLCMAAESGSLEDWHAPESEHEPHHSIGKADRF